MRILLQAIALEAIFQFWQQVGRLRQRWEETNALECEMTSPEMLDKIEIV